jgi:hypothetical protein
METDERRLVARCVAGERGVFDRLYLPSGYPQVPNPGETRFEVAVADARALQYGTEKEYRRKIYWSEKGLAAAEPNSSDAQARRLDLGYACQRAGDMPRATQLWREIIAVSRRHPETWDYYRKQAEYALRGLGRP